MKKTVLILIATLISIYAHAQLPESFLGKWEGSGSLYNTDATFGMEWEQVLNDKFYRLDFMNALNNRAFSMVAHGYYQIKGDSVSGYWLDSRGVSFPLSGTLDKQTLTINWGTEDFEQGKTEYTLLESDEMEVTDFVLRNGEYVPFGKAIYQRIKE